MLTKDDLASRPYSLPMNNLSVASNIIIEMKWWPRRDGTSRHIWVPITADKVLPGLGACDEMECIAISPGVCPCGRVEWIGVA